MPSDFYNTRKSRTEPDIRAEVERTLFGGFPEIAKGHPAVLRKMRRDSDGVLVPCACVDETTQEPDRDTWCAFCFSEGYYWDETFITTYREVLRSDVGNSTKQDLIGPGLMNIEVVSFYLDYSIDITEDDKIVELVLDKAGDPVKPYKRADIYKIETLIPFRADYGRLEYWKVLAHREQVKFLNGRT